MSRFYYSKLSNTASRLINRFGKTVKKRTVTNSGSAFNPTQTLHDDDIDGVVVNFSKNEIDGTLILTTDKKLLTKMLLEIGDSVVDGSIVYSVVSVDTIQPSDVVLLYKAQLRV